MTEDEIKKLAKQVKSGKLLDKPYKVDKTLRMEEPNFTILNDYCKSKGLFVSDVINKLIAIFLADITDDLK